MKVLQVFDPELGEEEVVALKSSEEHLKESHMNEHMSI